MYYAREAKGIVDVIADQAVRGRRYFCPVCKAPVALRDGRYRAAHFAHRPGVGRPDCENYHPGWGSPAPIARPPEAGDTNTRTIRPGPLQLAMELLPEPKGSRAMRRSWGLNVIVPSSSDGRGTIKLDLGSLGYREIKLSTLSLGSKEYAVDPRTPTFRVIWSSHDVAPAYAEAVAERIDGLSETSITAFAASASKLKPRVDSLSWGAPYYFVWHDRFCDELPETLGPRPLAASGDIQCALVTIPEFSNDLFLEGWLTEATGLPLVLEKRRWGVMLPPPLGLSSEGQIVVPAGPSIQLSIRPGIHEADAASTISASAATFSASSPVTPDHWQSVLIGTPDVLTDAPVHISWDRHALPNLVRIKQPPSRENEVLVELQSVNGDSDVVRLHEANASEAIACHRRQNGVANLRSAHGITGAVRWRSDNPVWAEAGGTDLIPLMRDQTLDIEIDFGPFGYVFLAGRPVGAMGLMLSAPLRRRLEWLSNAARAYRTSKGVAVASASDAELVEHVRGLKPPSVLAGHHRLLLRTVGAQV